MIARRGLRRRLRSDDGAAVIAALALVAVLAVCALAIGAVATVVAARSRAGAAADLAALAAAPDALLAPAAACAQARDVAAATGAELASGSVADGDVVVVVRVRLPRASPLALLAGGAVPEAAARAGLRCPASYSCGAPAWSTSSSRIAPALSRGSLPLPHLGDCTHDGQPSAHSHDAIASRVAESHVSAAA